MFDYFQPADSILPNSDGPLSTAVPVSTIGAANREVKPVCWPSDAALMDMANWDTVNL